MKLVFKGHNSWIPLFCELICTSDVQINGNSSCKDCVFVIQLLWLCYVSTSIFLLELGLGFYKPQFSSGRSLEGDGKERGERKDLHLLFNWSCQCHLNSNLSFSPKQFVQFAMFFHLPPKHPMVAFRDMLGSIPTQMSESQL